MEKSSIVLTLMLVFCLTICFTVTCAEIQSRIDYLEKKVHANEQSALSAIESSCDTKKVIENWFKAKDIEEAKLLALEDILNKRLRRINAEKGYNKALRGGTDDLLKWLKGISAEDLKLLKESGKL